MRSFLPFTICVLELALQEQRFKNILMITKDVMIVEKYSDSKEDVMVSSVFSSKEGLTWGKITNKIFILFTKAQIKCLNKMDKYG